MELSALQRVYDQIQGLGADLVAISPQVPAKNAEMRAKHRISFPILSDAGNAYARSLALAHGLPDDLRAIYEGFGIDLPAGNGDESWELPLATRIVAAADGTILSIDADPDYTRRPEPEASLDVLRGAA